MMPYVVISDIGEVEPKDDIRARLGCSTDMGDAVVLAFISIRLPGGAKGCCYECNH